jgi:hypothetical protein
MALEFSDLITFKCTVETGLTIKFRGKEKLETAQLLTKKKVRAPICLSVDGFLIVETSSTIALKEKELYI